ncbi:MAG: acetyl-CoA carboxylase biotin carboxylase subunit [Pseudomonadota bacterium]
MNRFTSVLIANRGEIACRVIRTAKEQGYKTVAVYSQADALSPHVQMADQAVLIGAGPVAESYLCADKIIEAARSSGAQSIHPGYGFLSENADFAKACDQAGLVFIGPSAHAISAMGNKAEAKRLMIAAKVPCVPGYEGEDQDVETLVAEGKKIGAPLMVKAAAGGGGRGMRLVDDLSELENAISLARNEAEGAFGSGELILERAIIKPRHVEVQVFADRHGNTIYLGERDCSIQRRHQKVVEEAPCPVMTGHLREQMGKAAVDAAKSIDYQGAGTVEFLLDQSGAFYFLEMNTRLQVEHPVTELITGLDLVALQLQVAQGDQIGITQEEVKLSGHAIEVRLYTEDPAQDFLPTSGPVTLWRPAEGEGIRVDSGICSGQDISPFYDPMVAKVIAYGSDRETARLRLIEALKRSCLFGTTTNKRFLIACLEKPAFAAGQATTAFIEEQFADASFVEPEPSLEEAAVAAVLAMQYDYERAQAASLFVAPGLKNWQNAEIPAVRKHYVFDDCEHNLFIHSSDTDRYAVRCEDGYVQIKLLDYGNDAQLVEVAGNRHRVDFLAISEAEHFLAIDGRTLHFKDQIRLAGAVDGSSGGGSVTAPMHGMLLEIRVSSGDSVSKGQTVAILEAMKMHYEIQADADGVVSDVLSTAGTQVAADTVLIEIDLSDEIA